MIIIGAGGLAKQILDVVERLNLEEAVMFFDDVNEYLNPPKLFNYTILQKTDDIISYSKNSNHSLVLGVANPVIRKSFYKLFKKNSINFKTLIASSALIGKHEVEIAEGTVILEHVILESSVKIGKGALINTSSKIFHDSIIGDFCEIAPNCNILGKCIIGDNVFVGAGTTILPGIKIGNNAKIGAGAVVTKNVLQGVTVKGVPAKI